MPDDEVKRGPGRPRTVEPPVAPTVYPTEIKLLSPHGFIDDAGNSHYWFANMLVSVEEQVKILVDRGVEYIVSKV